MDIITDTFLPVKRPIYEEFVHYMSLVHSTQLSAPTIGAFAVDKIQGQCSEQVSTGVYND